MLRAQAQPITRTESAAIDTLLARFSKAYAPQPYLIRNVSILTMKDSILLTGQDVLIEEGIIRKIGSNMQIAGATLIDGTGKYPMPGLADMHVHLFEKHPMKNTWMLILLLNGITTVRDMCGEEGKLALRESIRRNQVLGPTLYQAGQAIDGVRDRSGLFAFAPTPEAGRALVIAQMKAGYDFIKVYDGLSREAYIAILEEAHRQGMPVFGHVPNSVPVEEAMTLGQNSIEHLTGCFEWKSSQVHVTALPQYMEIAARTRTWNCPTLYNNQMNGSRQLAADVLTNAETASLLPAGLKKEWGKRLNSQSGQTVEVVDKYGEGNYEAIKGIAQSLYRAKAGIVAGTDAGNLPFLVPGFSLHRELGLLAGIGMSPYQVLQSATCNAAQMMKKDAEFGSVEEGKRADLLLLNSNPLTDIGNLKDRAGMMVRGIWLPRAELDRVRGEIRTAFSR